MKKLTMFAKILIAVGLLSCASTDKSEPLADLDIELKKTPIQNRAAEQEKRVDETKAVLDAKAVLDWQRFFKSPPTEEERSVLKQKLVRWADTENEETLLKKARTQFVLGEIVAAEVTYRELLRKNADNQDALLELSQLYLRKNQLDRCFDYLEQARRLMGNLEIVPNEFAFRYKYTLALAYIARGERRKGHDILSDLIAIDKAFSPAYAALSSSYLAIDKYSVAEFIAKRGIDRGKKVPELTNILGVVALRTGKTAEAKKWFDETIKLSPSFASALINRANQTMIRGEFEAAENDLHIAIAAAPDNVDAFVALGIIQKRTGRYSDARNSFNKAIDINPESAVARYNLAVLMLDHLGEPNDALRLFHEVMQTHDDNAGIKQLAKLRVEELHQSQLN